MKAGMKNVGGFAVITECMNTNICKNQSIEWLIKAEGKKEPRKQGRKKTSKEARKEESKEARKQGSKEARKQGSKEARKQGRKEARKEARKQGSKEGSKEGRKERGAPSACSMRCWYNESTLLMLSM
jgi:hypothetical protein